MFSVDLAKYLNCFYRETFEGKINLIYWFY